ncbi:MAG: hypothetical protein R3A10_12405 [Caldilineaceae bacterium]
MDQLPRDAAVTATAAVHPHVSHRRYVYQFPIGLDADAPELGNATWALLDVTTNTDMARATEEAGGCHAGRGLGRRRRGRRFPAAAQRRRPKRSRPTSTASCARPRTSARPSPARRSRCWTRRCTTGRAGGKPRSRARGVSGRISTPRRQEPVLDIVTPAGDGIGSAR